MLGQITDKKFRLRVFYTKTGSLAYLSHLELARALEASVRRSGLPYCLTQGYSPHMKISFGRALGVGIESKCQIFDIYLNDYIADKIAFEILKSNMPENLAPIKCMYVDNDATACSDVFTVNEYRVLVEGVYNNLKIPSKIEIVKKKKLKLFNTMDFLVDQIELSYPIEDRTQIDFTLKIKTSGSMKPDVFITQLFKNSGFEKPRVYEFILIDAH